MDSNVIPRWCASQSVSTSIKATFCELVAMYLRSFVLVIVSGSFIPFNFLMWAETSQPCKCAKDPFEAITNTYFLDLIIDGGS